MAKKTKKKCVRKTKAGKKCKGLAVKGRKTCMAHGPKRKKAKKKVAKKTRKKAKRTVVRAKSGVKRTKARCRKLMATGRRCKCYCEPGGIYCLSHRKKDKKATAAKISKNPNPSSINLPWSR
jgi:hypothetical protein